MAYLPVWLPPDEARSYAISISASNSIYADGELEFQLCAAVLDGQVRVRLDGRQLTPEEVKRAASRTPLWRRWWRELPEGIELLTEDIRRHWHAGSTCERGVPAGEVPAAESTALDAAPSGPQEVTSVRRRGRRPSFDWVEFHAWIASRVGTDPDGFPILQADLEREMAVWCQNTWGVENCPAESTIRKQIARYYQDNSKADKSG